MKDSEDSMTVPWVALAVTGLLIVLGVMVHLGSDDHVRVLEFTSSMGFVLLALAAGGLVAGLAQQNDAWVTHTIRWSTVALLGGLMLVPGWGTALGLGLAVFGMAWAGGGERRY